VISASIGRATSSAGSAGRTLDSHGWPAAAQVLHVAELVEVHHRITA
jgi:hypothetical protein